MPKKSFILLLILLMHCAQSVHATDDLPPPFKSSFKLFRGQALPAKVSISLLKADNGQFIYRSEVILSKWVAIFYKFHLLQESRWQVKNQKIQPLEYTYTLTKKKAKRHKKIIFDWVNKQAYANKYGKDFIFPLEEDMSDELTFHISAIYDLNMNRPRTSYTFIEGSKIKTYNVEKSVDQMIEIPAGQFNTIKLMYRGKYKRKTAIWFAEELHYIPIKFENTDKNGTLTTGILNTLTWLE